MYVCFNTHQDMSTCSVGNTVLFFVLFGIVHLLWKHKRKEFLTGKKNSLKKEQKNHSFLAITLLPRYLNYAERPIHSYFYF